MADGPRIEITSSAASRAFTGDTVRLGRAADNDVVVLNANVSRHHAELRHDGTTWELVDLGSTQGVFVDGTRVTRHRVDGPTDVVLGQPGRGVVLRITPLVSATDATATHPPDAAAPTRVPHILADPPTRRVHRRPRS